MMPRSRRNNFVRVAWRPMKTAPRDGSWVLLDVDDGSKDGYDDGIAISSVFVGRWNPKCCFPDIGPHFYEWETIVRYPDGMHGNGDLTNHYVEGRIGGWLPMPVAITTP